MTVTFQISATNKDTVRMFSALSVIFSALINTEMDQGEKIQHFGINRPLFLHDFMPYRLILPVAHETGNRLFEK